MKVHHRHRSQHPSSNTDKTYHRSLGPEFRCLRQSEFCRVIVCQPPVDIGVPWRRHVNVYWFEEGRRSTGCSGSLPNGTLTGIVSSTPIGTEKCRDRLRMKCF